MRIPLMKMLYLFLMAKAKLITKKNDTQGNMGKKTSETNDSNPSPDHLSKAPQSID